MEQAIQKAGRSKYGHEHDIRAVIDRRTGEIQLARYIEVADPVENEITRSEEHTSELQSLMRISYAVFCLKKKTKTQHPYTKTRKHTKHEPQTSTPIATQSRT